MLNFYLTTVVIWMIIIYATALLFGPKIKENGWITDDVSASRGLFRFLAAVLIPGVRGMLWASLFAMWIYTKEQFEELTNQ